MDSLDCRSPARCATCVHSRGAGSCALEQQLAVLFARPRAPARRAHAGPEPLVARATA